MVTIKVGVMITRIMIIRIDRLRKEKMGEGRKLVFVRRMIITIIIKLLKMIIMQIIAKLMPKIVQA